jgi:hypothetical protein
MAIDLSVPEVGPELMDEVVPVLALLLSGLVLQGLP